MPLASRGTPGVGGTGILPVALARNGPVATSEATTGETPVPRYGWQAPAPPVCFTAVRTKSLDLDTLCDQNQVSGSDPGIGIGNMRKRAWFKTVMEQVHGDIPERNAPVFNLTQPDALRFPSAWPRSRIFCPGAGRLQPRRALAAY